MIAIEQLEQPPTFDVAALSAFMQTLFNKRRKQLGAILGRSGTWPVGIEPTMRPEELAPEQVVELMHAR